ncbi:UNVERIFIED_CONTAM: hypothetical protein Slati_4174700 [Sesamum latifolium]|uniref:Uncharacterized protein n=1 Tax=Sesamum latifolium TaxID=2727402 RepID=A0AAW2TBH1_9LAMI
MCAELPQVRRRSRRVRPFGARDANLCGEWWMEGHLLVELRNLPTGEYEQIVEMPIVKTRCLEQATLGVARSGR